MCNCNRIQIVKPTAITQATGTTTITLPTDFTPVNGGIYDIPLTTAIPDGTNGTVITISIGADAGAVSGNLLNRLGSNVRMGTLNAQWVLRVMYLEDPVHWNLIGRHWRAV